jgi:anti-sigma regulatory factor (Ser/Thr protein kinase)
MPTEDTHHACAGGYRHEAFFYGRPEQFMEGVLAFVREPLEAGEPVLAVLGAAKIDALREELGEVGERVLFADMAEVGENPARIIPAWADFLETHAAPGRRLWGIGEPIWAGRGSAELIECQRHEALLNVAFGEPSFSLLCPYDTESLAPEVIEEACRSHPFLRQGAYAVPSIDYPGAELFARPFEEPLPEPPEGAAVHHFAAGSLREIRALVGANAARAGLSEERVADLVLAVNEIATNSILHGGGKGTVRVWREPDALVCEVRDGGRIKDPLAGRRRPAKGSVGGHGLWLANQLCELVQVRTFATGSVVRLHLRLVDCGV